MYFVDKQFVQKYQAQKGSAKSQSLRIDVKWY